MLIILFYYQEQQWRTLDNSENNNKINKEKTKKGDNDGRQQEQSNKEKQSQSEAERKERKQKQERAINRIREWMDGGGHNGDVSVINKRRGDNSAQNGLVEYTIEPKPEIKKIFEEGGMPTPSFNQLKKNDNKAIDTFKNAIAKAKQSLGGYGASVELKDDYTDINLYLSEDGESGFGIKPNGDIVSVFSSKKVKGRAHHLLEMAVYEGGGRQLDCFDIYLTKIYETHGFKPVAKMKWNDEYIPEGWNKDNFKDYNNGEPDVVFMVYDPNNTKKDNEIPYIVDYDDGDKIQQKYFEEREREREREKAKNKKENKITKNNKITITNKSRDGLDKTEDKINNFLKGNANKLKEEVKEETQADAKKEFKESDVNRDADGKFATKNSSNDKKDNSNPKKSNCNIGDTYNIAINSMATIPAKKLFESDNYELYEENANKLKPQQRKAIENAINNISKQYNELFNIYGKSDNQPTKKLKIVLLDESRKKKLKSTAGFVIKEGADNEEDNSIFLNTSAIKKEKENNIQKIIAHETIHTIINDNLRNKKMYFRPSNLLEEALAESGTFIVDGDNYREPPEDLDIDKKTKWILYNKYYFTSNLMHYLYLKNNKNSDIFKDIVNNMQGKEDSKFANAIQKTANKIGIEGGFSEIIKYWIKDKYNFNDEEAGDFKRTLMIKLENPKWQVN